MYDPIRSLWEGSSMGEGILKSIIPNVSSVNFQWHVVSTKTIYQQKSISRLADQVKDYDPNDIESEEELKFYGNENNFHLYGVKQNVIDAYHSGQPISVVINDKNNMYAVFNNMTAVEFLVGNNHSVCLGHNYFHMDPPEQFFFEQTLFYILAFGILLPKISSLEDEDECTDIGIYTLITSNWIEILEDKTIGFYNFNSKQQVVEEINNFSSNQNFWSTTDETTGAVVLNALV